MTPPLTPPPVRRRLTVSQDIRPAGDAQASLTHLVLAFALHLSIIPDAPRSLQTRFILHKLGTSCQLSCRTILTLVVV